MDLSSHPVLTPLKHSRRILIAGAGGGFDVFCGLPLYFHLRAQGREVHLANLSFTQVAEIRGERLAHGLVRVDAQTEGPARYFPEGLLARYLQMIEQPAPVFTFAQNGVRQLAANYRLLKEQFDLDAVVLVDGGTDILMRGDEAGLGTPAEDISSLAAVDSLEVATRLVVCLGFGIDRFHGVCHAQYLEAVAELSRAGGFLGTFALTAQMPEVRRYLEAISYACDRMPAAPSIVGTSIASAIEGHYGDHHRVERTRGSQLWINPLMTLYWSFELGAVARRCLYLEAIKNTASNFEIAAVIEAFRNSCPAIKDWEDIPV